MLKNRKIPKLHGFELITVNCKSNNALTTRLPSHKLLHQCVTCSFYEAVYDYAVYCTMYNENLLHNLSGEFRIPTQISCGMGQVSKSSYFASANDVLMTTITKLNPQVEASIPVWLPFVFATPQHRKLGLCNNIHL